MKTKVYSLPTTEYRSHNIVRTAGFIRIYPQNNPRQCVGEYLDSEGSKARDRIDRILAGCPRVYDSWCADVCQQHARISRERVAYLIRAARSRGETIHRIRYTRNWIGYDIGNLRIRPR